MYFAKVEAIFGASVGMEDGEVEGVTIGDKEGLVVCKGVGE